MPETEGQLKSIASLWKSCSFETPVSRTFASVGPEKSRCGNMAGSAVVVARDPKDPDAVDLFWRCHRHAGKVNETETGPTVYTVRVQSGD